MLNYTLYFYDVCCNALLLLLFCTLSCFFAPDNRFDSNGCTSTQTVCFPGGFFLYSKLIFPLDPNDAVLLEIPVIISQGVSQKYRLALDDLIYVEACQHRLILHTIQGDFTTRCTFTDLTVCLTPSDRFFHGGKGLLINFAHVSLVQVTGEILLKNGQIIFCSRRRRRETREAFLVYAGAGKFSYETI